MTTLRNLLLIFVSGSAKFVIDGNEYNIRRGCQLLIPAGSHYVANAEESC